MSRERRGNNLTRDEVDNLAKIQTRMVRVAMGEIPFEYPGMFLISIHLFIVFDYV